MQVPLWFHDLVTDWLHPGDSQHLVARMAKNLPTMQDTRVQSLVREDPLEKEMVTHSSTLAGKSHGPRSLVGYSPWICKDLDTTK